LRLSEIRKLQFLDGGANRANANRSLHEEVDAFFTTAAEDDFAAVVHDDTEETDKGHGRLEVRRY
jgi:hypothetical protein